MESAKLQEIIKNKNERLERDALHSAEEIIEKIAQQQANIDIANTRILELRQQLKKLEVKQLDPTAVLGLG